MSNCKYQHHQAVIISVPTCIYHKEFLLGSVLSSLSKAPFYCCLRIACRDGRCFFSCCEMTGPLRARFDLTWILKMWLLSSLTDSGFYTLSRVVCLSGYAAFLVFQPAAGNLPWSIAGPSQVFVQDVSIRRSAINLNYLIFHAPLDILQSSN